MVDEIEKMDILNLCISPESLKNTMALIVVDLQKPWNIISDISKWMRALINLVSENMQKLPYET
jgi:tRNA A58 N-methylase Trm61